tara:strand:+ start:282 stop:533 length:252 start_codon:yes stop_codon:yes gene_type:complete
MVFGMIIPNIYLDIKEVLSLYNNGFISANTKKFMRIGDLPLSKPEGKVLSTLSNYLECSSIKGQCDTIGSIPNLEDDILANKK